MQRLSLQFGDYSVRSASDNDEKALRFVIDTVMSEYGLQANSPSGDSNRLDIDGNYHRAGGHFFMVLHGDVVCATMAIAKVSDETCELQKMYLLAEVRGKGLGRFLLDLAQAEALRMGYKRMQLETASVLKEAIALYEKNAFIREQSVSRPGRCDRVYSKSLIKE